MDLRKILVLVPAALLTAGLSYSLSSPTSGSLIAAALADPLSVFADRSPGTRTTAALNQTKKARAHSKDGSRAVAANPPSERVLTNVRTRPPVAVPDASQYTDALLTTPLASDGAAVVPDIGILPPAAVAPTGIGSIPGFAPGGVGFLPGGGGGGGGGVVPVEPGAPVAGVPETSTWLMLIVGFFAIGWSLRSRPKGFFGERERVSG
ncbi:hypothetical protein [Sphingomonas sp. GB1N7]|uniref:hypothetical protein n=1 Tax=Parasphingomonas caseinilytica TaxID=3096158 RepID=UPI002FC7847B